MHLSFDVPQVGHRGLLELSAICTRSAAETILTGYLRLHCDKAVEPLNIGVRSIGFQQVKVQAKNNEGTLVLAPSPLSPTRAVWHERADVYVVVDNEWHQLEADRRFAAGSHLLAWRLRVPNSLPPSGESWLAKASYSIVASSTTTSTSWLRGSEQASASRDLLLCSHPSNSGPAGLNPVDYTMRPSTELKPLKCSARLSTANCRFGGCFTIAGQLYVPNSAEAIELVLVQLKLEQHWMIRTQVETEGTDQVSQLVVDELRRWTGTARGKSQEFQQPQVHAAPSPASLKDTLSEDTDSSADPALHFSFSSHFPPGAEKGQSGFYATTLDFTRVSVRFRHILTCRLTLILQGQEREVVFEVEPTIVANDLSTNNLLVPAYSATA